MRVITGHGGTVYSVVFSPDGRRLISGSADRTVKLWDVASGLELHTLDGNTNWVRDVAVSSDGNLIATAGKDHRVRIWDARAPSKARAPSNELAAANDLIVEREAAAIVAASTARFGTLEPTLDPIRSLPTISEPVRAAALRQADQYLFHWDLLLTAHAAADRGDWPAAVAAFDQVVKLATGDVMHWHWLALASLAAGRREGAEGARSGARPSANLRRRVSAGPTGCWRAREIGAVQGGLRHRDGRLGGQAGPSFIVGRIDTTY